MAAASAISTGILGWNQFRSWKQRSGQDKLNIRMRHDSCERILFVTANRDGDTLVKFRIKNQSEFEVWLQDPTIGFRDQVAKVIGESQPLILRPGHKHILEAEISDYDIDSLDISEFKIVDTGHANKV